MTFGVQMGLDWHLEIFLDYQNLSSPFLPCLWQLLFFSCPFLLVWSSQWGKPAPQAHTAVRNSHWGFLRQQLVSRQNNDDIVWVLSLELGEHWSCCRWLCVGEGCHCPLVPFFATSSPQRWWSWVWDVTCQWHGSAASGCIPLLNVNTKDWKSTK